jgi:hypothetical protein
LGDFGIVGCFQTQTSGTKCGSSLKTPLGAPRPATEKEGTTNTLTVGKRKSKIRDNVSRDIAIFVNSRKT